MHQLTKILFCHETLHVSGSFYAHHQELSAVNVATGMFHAGYVALKEPYILRDPDNFTPANPSVTPVHIQPE